LSHVEDIRNTLNNAKHRLRIALPLLNKNDLKAIVDEAETLFEMLSGAVHAATEAEEMDQRAQEPAGIPPDNAPPEGNAPTEPPPPATTPELENFGKVEPQEPGA
jgi:hypothetical protein